MTAQRWVTEEDHEREVAESYLAGRRAAVSENYEHWSNMRFASLLRIKKAAEKLPNRRYALPTGDGYIQLPVMTYVLHDSVLQMIEQEMERDTDE